MTKRRTPEQWQELMLHYQQSGLSVAQFCLEHQLGESNFYLKLKKFKSSVNSLSTFVAVRPEVLPSQAVIKLHYDKCQLQLPDDMSVDWVAQLMKSLS